MTDLHQEARRRVPSLTDVQWSCWLEYVERHNGVLTLPIGDGAPFAVYPDQDAQETPLRVSNHQERPTAVGDEIRCILKS